MKTEFENCPNCNIKLKANPLSRLSLSQPIQAKLIQEYTDLTSEYFCEKCGRIPYANSLKIYYEEKEKIESELKSKIPAIPIISSQPPISWDYEIFDLITAQSVTGTGVISELTSSFSDLFGTQSSSLNKKLKEGENLCFAQLRKQVLDLGGNAVIATDIDYAEIGGNKGMIMVCISGTAIKINNLSVLGHQRESHINELVILNKRNMYLNTFKNLPQYL